MNELVIFKYSLKRALNSSFKCYELAVRERAHVLIPSQAGAYLQGWTNGTKPSPEGKIIKYNKYEIKNKKQYLDSSFLPVNASSARYP